MKNTNNQAGPALLQEVSCNLCGSIDYVVLIKPNVTEYDPVEVVTASKGIRGTQRIVRCRECGLVYVNPRINEKTVANSYKDAVDEIYVQGAAGRKHTFRQCVKKINKWRRPPGRLLDIGCAAGFFVHEATKQGWDSMGIEPSRWLVSWGIENLKVKLRTGTLRQGKFKDEDFDVLTMWDVLEHVPDPLSELKECHRILKTGGMLVINYPDFGSFLAKLAGSKWWFLLSNHLYYFTTRTMREYLEKTGFEVKHFTMHWQTLPLGYLSKIFSIYSPGLSRLSERVLRNLRIGNIPIPYYAAQTNVVAVKQ